MFRTAQTGAEPGAYRARVAAILPVLPVPQLPEDFRFVPAKRRGRTYARSGVLLARAHFDGQLELLTVAWETLVSSTGPGFATHTLRSLMGVPLPESASAVAAILDRRDPAPVDLTVRDYFGGERRLRLHRRFEADGPSVYIVAEELREA